MSNREFTATRTMLAKMLPEFTPAVQAHAAVSEWVPAAEVRMSTDEAREYLVKFMEQYFTDKTFHRYIRGQISGSGPLAGDFAWQMARALRMILAQQSTADKASEVRAAEWISVEDQLPEPETDVLIMHLGQTRIGAIFIEHESWEEGGREIHYWDDSNDDGQGWGWCEVTHWMPLPAAPSTADSANTGALGEKGGRDDA